MSRLSGESRIRTGLCLAGLAGLVLALGFFQAAGWATGLWPWSDTPLSFAFIASILAAIALPALWIGVSGELAAIRAGALELSLTYGGIFIYMLFLAEAGSLSRWLAAFGAACASSVAVFIWSRRLTWRDQRAMPAPVRWSFLAFVAILVPVGAALVLGADVFPWDPERHGAVIYGLIFLGAAVYFAHGFLEHRWPNAVGQLIGFLAYDIVLIGPFLDRLDEVSGRQLLSLIIYTAVLLYSAAIAFYYLFVAEATRLR